MYVNKAVRLNPRIISNAVGMSNFLKKNKQKTKKKKPHQKTPRKQKQGNKTKLY